MADNIPDLFKGVIPRDMFRLFCGDMLGRGCYREVYEHSLSADGMVLKFENGAGDFANVQEWEVWKSVEHVKGISKWFAPCIAISPCGTVLMQRMTTPAHVSMLPKKVPAFFTDLKPSNWGMLNGKIVCHDYGLHLLHENGMTKRMIKAVWSE